MFVCTKLVKLSKSTSPTSLLPIPACMSQTWLELHRYATIGLSRETLCFWIMQRIKILSSVYLTDETNSKISLEKRSRRGYSLQRSILENNCFYQEIVCAQQRDSKSSSTLLDEDKLCWIKHIIISWLLCEHFRCLAHKLQTFFLLLSSVPIIEMFQAFRWKFLSNLVIHQFHVLL